MINEYKASDFFWQIKMASEKYRTIAILFGWNFDYKWLNNNKSIFDTIYDTVETGIKELKNNKKKEWIDYTTHLMISLQKDGDKIYLNIFMDLLNLL